MYMYMCKCVRTEFDCPATCRLRLHMRALRGLYVAELKLKIEDWAGACAH